MLKKSTLIASILLVSACSSTNMATTASTDYVNDVVVQKNQQQGYVEIVGKDIAPVDLMELNLGLRVSTLSVVANIQDAEDKTAESNVKAINSTVYFDIEYVQEKSAKETQDNPLYNVALVDGFDVILMANEATRSCDEKQCVVSQSFNFPVASDLLENSKQDGLKFSLFETSNTNKLVLETMIPARYIDALLAK